MDTRRKTVFRLSELAELRRQLDEPLSAEERERRHRAVERIKRFRDSMPIIPGDMKDWIRADRGETQDGCKTDFSTAAFVAEIVRKAVTES